jgi:hypothetical protein
MVSFFVGLDLGQSSDFTALSVLEQVKSNREPDYYLRRLERVRGLDYPAIVRKVARVMKSRELTSNATLIIDQTGVGRPVFDLFVQSGLNPIGVSITGGDGVTHDGNQWRVPKRDLVSVLQIVLQNGRLKISNRLTLADALQSELLNFQMKISEAGHDSYAAKGSLHDDLVLSVALAAWYASRQSQNLSIPINFNLFRGEPCVPAWNSEIADSEPWLSDE